MIYTFYIMYNVLYLTSKIFKTQKNKIRVLDEEEQRERDGDRDSKTGTNK